LCCNTILAQYFNSTYNNTSFYSELSSHISILSDSTYLVPSVSTDESGFHYNWRVIGTNGIEIAIQNLIDASIYLYPGRIDSFFQLIDGNYLQSYVAGRPGFMKFNAQGEMIWELEIDSIVGTSNAMLELNDGDIFFLADYVNGAHINIARTNGLGEIELFQYATPIDSTEALYLEKSKELPDKEILIGGLGIFYRGMATDIDGVMLRVDSLGNVMWTKIWDDDINDQRAFFCDGDDDSTVVMPIKKVVWYLDNDNHQPYTAHVGTALVNVNTGDTSNVHFPELILDNPKVWEIIRTPDQGYCLMGEANDDDHSFTFLMKLDQNRELEWYKTYAPEPPEIDPTFSLTSWDIEITPDSGFVVCGEATDWGNNGPGKQMPWVFKTDHCGELEWNNCGTIHVAALTKEKMQCTVFPNPAKDMLTVSLSGNTTQQHLSVFDATGKLLFEQRLMPFIDSVQLDIHPWPSGIYVVRLMDENGKAISKRVVKE
jgi:hypothetical protein